MQWSYYFSQQSIRQALRIKKIVGVYLPDSIQTDMMCFTKAVGQYSEELEKPKWTEKKMKSDFIFQMTINFSQWYY